MRGSWQDACLHSVHKTLSPALCRLGMVVDTRNTNTGEVEAMDQGFKIICDCKVSSKLAWDTQKPVSKTKQNKTSKTKKAKGECC